LPELSPAEHGARRHGTLSSLAARTVRELIVSGQLLPHEQLQIDEIARWLGISATPVREALATLRVEGFVESVPRQGFRVRPTTPEDIADAFLVHADVAGELAARAVEIITDEQVRELSSLHYEMMAAALRGDHTTLEHLNNTFHRSLNLVVDAPFLHRMVALCSKFVPLDFYPVIDGWPEATRSEHVAIIEALESRDPAAARTAMREHILHSGELLAAHLRSALAARSQTETG
jgi:DNA-binding GntR family transcriptional regulator